MSNNDYEPQTTQFPAWVRMVAIVVIVALVGFYVIAALF
jgi:hypothetical protein